ncbi:heptahelical transmembrane protein ADIPOR3 isoform X2 [Ziziphus jujuba]|uniref:Heptahelical transmembrane protein ADIPOR3 isoform X2 n=1 Tax=Ziziphus jujuba TaxID=326968 RepID=A0A6P6FN32_ZIZJJ|nr:heptahelical transmembrane protein ADIPOR3 isoform X2 [Ziziphus jujuba]
MRLLISGPVRAPSIMDLYSIQHLHDFVRAADLQKIPKDLMSCLPSLPNVSGLPKLKDITTSLSSGDFISSFSGWNVLEVLNNCLRDRFSYADQTDANVLHGVNMVAPMLIQPVTRWPFFAFLGGAMFCLLASSACHLLSCHSENLSYVMLRLDYAGIAALISTSFYPPVYYSFMCNPFFCYLYLGFITILGIGTMIFSLIPEFQKPRFRVFRTTLFFGMGMSGVAPIIHKLVLYHNKPEAIETAQYEVVMGVLYGLGALIYATRIPERWMPGKFDIAGHSHQLFHVLVVAGAYTHYQAGLIYLRWRDSQGC